MAVPFQDVQGFTPAATGAGSSIDWAKLLSTLGAGAKDIGATWSGGQSNALGQMIQQQAVDEQERKKNEAMMSALGFLNPGGDKDPDYASAARALAAAPGMGNAALQMAMGAPRPERWDDVTPGGGGGGGMPGAVPTMGGAPAGGMGGAGAQPVQNPLIVQDWIHQLNPLAQGGTQQQGGPFRESAEPVLSAVKPSSFDERLAKSESGGRYNLVNSEGYSGKYQMGEAALAAAGVYQDDDVTDNKWNGRFVGLPGVSTHADFIASPEAQEAAFQRHKSYLNSEIERRGLDKYIGQTVNGVEVTRDGLLAAMHLAGPGGTARFLNTGGQHNPADSNGTTPLAYMARHGGGNSGSGGRVQVADAGGFTVPDATARAVNGGQQGGNAGSNWTPPFRVQRNRRTGEARYIDNATGTVFKPTADQMEYIQAVTSGAFRGDPLEWVGAKARAQRNPWDRYEVTTQGVFDRENPSAGPVWTPPVNQLDRYQITDRGVFDKLNPTAGPVWTPPLGQAERYAITPQGVFDKTNPAAGPVWTPPKESPWVIPGVGGAAPAGGQVAGGAPASGAVPAMGGASPAAPAIPAAGGQGQASADGWVRPFNPQTQQFANIEVNTRTGERREYVPKPVPENDILYQQMVRDGFRGDYEVYRGKLAAMGERPNDHRLAVRNGDLAYEPVPGTKAAREMEEAATKQGRRDEMAQRSSNIVINTVDELLKRHDSSVLPISGPVGTKLESWGAQDQVAVAEMIQTITANTGLDKLQQMREASPTGGALGSVTEGEHAMLKAALASLNQRQWPADLIRNAKKVANEYNSVVNGPEVPPPYPDAPFQIMDPETKRIEMVRKTATMNGRLYYHINGKWRAFDGQ